MKSWACTRQHFRRHCWGNMLCQQCCSVYVNVACCQEQASNMLPCRSKQATCCQERASNMLPGASKQHVARSKQASKMLPGASKQHVARSEQATCCQEQASNMLSGASKQHVARSKQATCCQEQASNMLPGASKQHVASTCTYRKCSILWKHVSQNIKGYLGDDQVQKSMSVRMLVRYYIILCISIMKEYLYQV